MEFFFEVVDYELLVEGEFVVVDVVFVDYNVFCKSLIVYLLESVFEEFGVGLLVIMDEGFVGWVYLCSGNYICV